MFVSDEWYVEWCDNGAFCGIECVFGIEFGICF